MRGIGPPPWGTQSTGIRCALFGVGAMGEMVDVKAMRTGRLSKAVDTSVCTLLHGCTTASGRDCAPVSALSCWVASHRNAMQQWRKAHRGLSENQIVPVLTQLCTLSVVAELISTNPIMITNVTQHVPSAQVMACTCTGSCGNMIAWCTAHKRGQPIYIAHVI